MEPLNHFSKELSFLDIHVLDRSKKNKKPIFLKNEFTNCELFPRIMVKIGGEEKAISRFRLEKFPKFNTALKVNNAWNKTEEITLSNSNQNEENVLKEFLNYLATDKIEITHDNVLDLMALAQEHILPELSRKCIEFLSKNGDSSQLKDLLEFAVQSKLDDLIWHCLISAYHSNAEFEGLSPDAEEIIETVKRLKKLKVEPFFDAGQRGVCITNLQEQKHDLLLLNRKIMLGALKIEDKNATEEQLQNLSQSLPNLYSLKIENDKIKCIPEIWLKKLKKLDCYKCSSLTSLNAPKAIRHL